MALSPSWIVLHAGLSPSTEVIVHLLVGLFRVGLGALIALPLIYLVYRPGRSHFLTVGVYVLTRVRAHWMLFAGIVSLATLSYIGLGAYWWTYFYQRVDWVTVIGSETVSRLPLFFAFAAYLTVFRESFEGSLPGRSQAVGTTGGVMSFAFMLLACPSCLVALFILLASVGFVGGSVLASLQYLNQVQAYAGYVTIFGTLVMVLGIFVMANGRCPVPTTDSNIPASERPTIQERVDS
jgi:hypothetical protein